MMVDKSFNKKMFLITTAQTNSSILIKINLKFSEAIFENYFKIVLFYKIGHEINSNDSETVNINHENSEYLKIKHELSSNFKIIRNILIDICKTIKTKKCLLNYLESGFEYKIKSVSLKGNGELIEPILTDDASFEIAKQAADYLQLVQDESGGWPMKIIRKFHENDNLYLDLNWNSAMLQGHALSLLTRLYSSTKNIIYLKSALNAVEIFYKSVNNNGVRTYFHDKFIWFEEYPTKPNSIFVLNGFIYSLIGLFDLSNCLKLIKNENYTKVYSLYENGMNSLVNLIMLFDSGTRTFYDLRHITNAPNSGNLFCF
jgi:heparosan-N-sulfate-glucuronate 5-epimerase